MSILSRAKARGRSQDGESALIDWQTTGENTTIISPTQLAALEISPEREPLDGNPDHFKLGIEAARLALAYEYDPFFSLSVARIDPLPHQLEAVYEYFVKLPRIRFLRPHLPPAVWCGKGRCRLESAGAINRWCWT